LYAQRDAHQLIILLLLAAAAAAEQAQLAQARAAAQAGLEQELGRLLRRELPIR
jgi:hypothetical protein